MKDKEGSQNVTDTGIVFIRHTSEPIIWDEITKLVKNHAKGNLVDVKKYKVEPYMESTELISITFPYQEVKKS